MCGIVGFAGPWAPQVLAECVTALAHRGPDDRGDFFDERHGIGLGHTRLAIVDLSVHGHQPMVRAEGKVVLVYNGELYNAPELRAELEAAGTRFEGHSDTEVLLELYLARGEAMLPRLNGIFAFAIWDERERSLFLARDAMGVKPLYYSEAGGRFAFASELKALRPLLPRAGELDTAALHRYLSFLWCPGEGTPLLRVRKLQPGTALRVRDGAVVRRWQWYQLPAFRELAPITDEASAIAGTAQHLRQAVRRQMIADVPVGAFLSGGLDSSAIVAFAREHNAQLRCFTIDARGGEEEGTAADLPYARQVARHLRVPLDVVTIEASAMAADLEGMVRKLDEPLADPAALNVYYISKLAREQGIKVLLSGSGGDDLFTGYRRHYAIALERYWAWLPHGLRRGLGKAARHLDQRRALQRRLAKAMGGMALDGDARLTNYFRWTQEAELLALYTPEVRRALAGVEADAPMRDFLRGLPAGVPRLERALALEQRFFLADHNLIYGDKMSMAVGLEVRVPFLDPDLLDFAATIPVGMKQRGREGKWVLKKAMEAWLPREVIYRPKTGFGAPLRRWMRHELRDLLGDVLGGASLRRRGLFDPAAVQALIAANDSGQVDASYTLLSLLCVELWCRAFLEP
jgi:asparagine synthase (glutamine-hydrolysing)